MDLIKTLEALNYFCTVQQTSHFGCGGCKFLVQKKGKSACQINWFIGNLTADPMYWDIEKLKEIEKL